MRLIHATCLLIFLFYTGCNGDRSVGEISTEEERTLDSFHLLNPPHQLSLTTEEEPGEPLLLCLTFIGKADGSTLAGQKVHFYHTNASGDYQPDDPNDESTARLNGFARTDSLGRIFIRTVLPGDYGSSTNSRHIHTTVEGAHPEAYDIHFIQYTSFLGKQFIRKSDQHFFADLKRKPTGELVGFVTLEVRFK